MRFIKSITRYLILYYSQNLWPLVADTGPLAEEIPNLKESRFLDVKMLGWYLLLLSETTLGFYESWFYFIVGWFF